MGKGDTMKYIIVETEDSGCAPILFDDAIAHNEMAKGVPGLIKVLSAGFIRLLQKDGNYDIECYGESVSLRIKADPEFDTYIVKSCFRRNFLLVESDNPKRKKDALDEYINVSDETLFS